MIILGTGSALPKRVVTNFDLEKIVDTSDEWIQERTGIRERHVITTETLQDLAVEACEKALEDAGKKAEDVDLILVASVSSKERFPCLACQVQDRIGAKKAAAFNISAACAGFLISLNTAYCYLKSGMYQNALIVGAEALSGITDWKDRSTCVLFGDGAGAVYVEWKKDHIYIPMQGSDGAGGSSLCCESVTGSNPFQEVAEKKEDGFLKMDGQTVYRFAVTKVPQCIRSVLDKGKISAEDVDLFVLHQANIRIIEAVAKRMKQPLEKFPVNIDRNGNISAACLPVLIDELNQQGKLKRGQKIVLSGFGAGFTFAAAFLEW